jgi:ABC-type transport system involved in multi-copper enzyme maturation permease subunit
MRLLEAEILKLRKRYGLMIWSAFLTVGSVVIAYGVMLALHASDPDKHGPAGGVHNLQNLMWLLTSLASVAAVLIGTTAGSQDASSGVFRDLAVSGRSRRTLFRVRYPGAAVVYLPIVVTAFAAAVAGSYLFAGGLPSPTVHDVVHYGITLGSLGLVTLALAVALGSIIPSRIATGVLIGWNAIVAGLLAQIGVLGAAREGIDTVAAYHFAPDVAARGTTVPMATGTAIAVLVVWIVVALRAGEWWTRRADA